MTTYLIIKNGHEHKEHKEHKEHRRDARKTFFKEAKDMLWNPPSTWHEHMADPKKIIDMEYRELKAAEAAGDMTKWRENVLHLAAACGLTMVHEYNKG